MNDLKWLEDKAKHLDWKSVHKMSADDITKVIETVRFLQKENKILAKELQRLKAHK